MDNIGIDDLNSKEKEHHINGVSLSGKDDILTKMISNVLNDKVDYNYNKEITLFTNKFIDKINKELFNKIAELVVVYLVVLLLGN